MAGGSDYSNEAIDQLLSKSEAERERLVIILAGYEKQMEKLLDVNSGVRSRFPVRVHFPDYTPDQLMEIAQRMADQLNAPLTEAARSLLRNTLLSKPLQGNARDVRNIIEKAAANRDTRIEHITGREPTCEELTVLQAVDFGGDGV